MDGTATAAQGFMASSPAPGWLPAGTADFNADGRADIVLRQSSTGAVDIY